MKIRTFILLSLFLTFSVGANENAIFWELESPEGKQIFIFGSIHVDDNRVVDFSDSVNNAMQKSDLFVSETNNVNNLKALEGLGSEYNKYLSDEDFQKISELSDFHSIETDFAIKLKPWLLGFILSSPRAMNPFSQDNLLK
ncbi:TraB/GumN family protein, partial [Methylophilaceae bacterium]|nr:TraB/GumN family protein [Methylophilaceae bacterium]